jgi:hypothetical protein
VSSSLWKQISFSTSCKEGLNILQIYVQVAMDYDGTLKDGFWVVGVCV